MSNKRAQIGPQAMIQFSKQFHSYLQNGWTEINAYLILAANPPIPVLTTPTTIDLANSLVEARIDSSKDMLKLNTMAILYHHLLGNLDQKLFNSIVDCNMKVSKYYPSILEHSIFFFFTICIIILRSYVFH